MHFQIIAAGILKSSPEKDLFEQYIKRLRIKPKIVEIDCKNNTRLSASTYMKFITEKDFILTLDEHGENISSRSFAQKLEEINQTGKRISFIIGGADGIPDEIKLLSRFSISFGKLTWPHLLVRTLLIEQIYRAQQILNNHPYHRD